MIVGQSNTLPPRVPGIVYCDGSDVNMGVTGKRKIVRCPVCNRSVAVWVAKHKTLELESQTRTAEGNKIILVWKQKCDALEAEQLQLKEVYEALRSQPQQAPTLVTPAGAEKFKTAIKNVKQMVEIGLMTAEEAWQKLEAFDPK